MRGRRCADVSHHLLDRFLQPVDVERLGHERRAAVAQRHQLVVDRRDEQVGNAEFGQPVGDGKDHAVAKLHIQHGTIEPLRIQQSQRIEHAVGVGHLAAAVFKRLLHQCSQVELVFNQQQIAPALAHFHLHARMPVLPWELQCVLCRINGVRVACQPGAKRPALNRQRRRRSVESGAAFVDGALAAAMDTAAVPRTGATAMPRSTTDSASPSALRVECMSLDCGGAAIVVELDSTPERAWMKSLKRALQDDDVLQGAQAKFDGRFVYVVGVEGGAHRAQHRVIQALKASAGTRTRAPAASPRRDAGTAVVSGAMPA